MKQRSNIAWLITMLILWVILVRVAAWGLVNDPPAGNPDGIEVGGNYVEVER